MIWISGIKKARSARKVSANYSKNEVGTHLQRSGHSLTSGKQGQNNHQAWYLRHKN